MEQQVDQGEPRPILEDQDHPAAERSAEAHRAGGDQGFGRPEHVGRRRQLDPVDRADGQPDVGAQPLRERLRSAFGAAFEDRPEDALLFVVGHGRPFKMAAVRERVGRRGSVGDYRVVAAFFNSPGLTGAWSAPSQSMRIGVAM